MKRLGALIIAFPLALAACGGDGAGNVAAACEGQVELFRAFGAVEDVFNAIEAEAGPPLGEEGPPGEGEEPPPGEGEEPRGPRGALGPESVRRVQEVYDEKMAPAVAKITDNAPDEIKDEVARARQVLTDFRSDPFLPKLREEFDPLDQRIGAYFFRECPGSKAAVDFADYAFRNLPTELKAGVTRLEVENVGRDAHDLVFISRTPKPGVTESLEQILRLPADRVGAKVNAKIGGFAAPGEKRYSLVELAAGEYVAVCFIPKGSTIPNPTIGKGQPHHTLGMRQDVKVT